MNFKMLASFINSYKGKLMISENLSIPSKSGGLAFEKTSKQNQILPLTKSELHQQKHEGEKDITLDYDIFMKIKH